MPVELVTAPVKSFPPGRFSQPFPAAGSRLTRCGAVRESSGLLPAENICGEVSAHGGEPS